MMCPRYPKTTLLILLILIFGMCLTFLNVYYLQQMQKEHWQKSHNSAYEPKPNELPSQSKKPIVWVKAKHVCSRFSKVD